MNPYLPDIRARHRRDTADQITLDLYLPASLDHFAGHFPGQPLLPGVVQIDWVARFAREYLGVTGRFTLLENVKFQAVLLPDAEVSLTLNWDRQKMRVDFCYARADRTYSSGRLQFGEDA